MELTQQSPHHFLTDQVKILRRTVVTTDGAGGERDVFNDNGEVVAARFHPVGGDRSFIQGQEQVSESAALWVDDGVGIKLGDQIETDDGRKWAIRARRTRSGSLLRFFMTEVDAS